MARATTVSLKSRLDDDDDDEESFLASPVVLETDMTATRSCVDRLRVLQPPSTHQICASLSLSRVSHASRSHSAAAAGGSSSRRSVEACASRARTTRAPPRTRPTCRRRKRPLASPAWPHRSAAIRGRDPSLDHHRHQRPTPPAPRARQPQRHRMAQSAPQATEIRAARYARNAPTLLRL